MFYLCDLVSDKLFQKEEKEVKLHICSRFLAFDDKNLNLLAFEFHFAVTIFLWMVLNAPIQMDFQMW
jgi:hypothetical protein